MLEMLMLLYVERQSAMLPLLYAELRASQRSAVFDVSLISQSAAQRRC